MEDDVLKENFFVDISWISWGFFDRVGLCWWQWWRDFWGAEEIMTMLHLFTYFYLGPYLSKIENVLRNTNWGWQKLLCKVDSLFWRVNFFPPNFPFTKYKRKVWREKILCKKVNFTLQRRRSFEISQFSMFH